jgi:hypothetical protein
MSAKVCPFYYGEGGTAAEEQGSSIIALVDRYARDRPPHRVFTIDVSGEAVLLLFGFQQEGGLCLDPAAPQADW